MKLTVEEHPDRIKRYSHMKPAPAWGGRRCGGVFPGTARLCTLAKGHRGPHVHHGALGRVKAVWDAAGTALQHDTPARSTTILRSTKGTQGLQHPVRSVVELFKAAVPELDTAIWLIFL